MAIDHYKMGYTSFVNGSVNEEQMKQQHPMFRSGWRAAQKQQEAKDRPITDLPIEKVVRKDPEASNYTYKWRDVTEACKLGPWRVLEERKQTQPLIVLMRKNIDDRKDEIRSFRDIMRMLRTQWEIMLEYGYAEGIFTNDDLLQYNYVPKALREAQ